MLCAKSIDELYEEVKDCSLVITNDIALVTALNAMVDSARVGTFAETPRMIAASLAGEVLGKGTMTDLEMITAISDETGYDFTFVHSEVENIRSIRRHTKEVRKHLHTRAAREVYDSYVRIPTIEAAMDAFDVENSPFIKAQRSIAVIGPELFDQLDRNFVPLDNTEIVELFKEGAFYDIGRIHQVGNDRQIAENAVAMIPQDRPQDFAIVVKTDSPMADAVRSALYRRGLPFINKMSVRDLDYIRDYLNFVTLALDFETLRVKDVKEIFSNYNGYFNHGRDNFLLHRQGPEDMKDRCWNMFCLMRDIRSHTFSEVADICSKEARIQVRIVLQELGLSDKEVTSKLVGRLTYAVDNVRDLRHSTEIPADEKMGVLVADCVNSVYMDRPVVLYLGMEQDWNPNLVGKPYIVVDDETEKECKRMMAMLQQGQHRYYLVNKTKNGAEARPCLLFDEIFGNGEFLEDGVNGVRTVKTFADICDEVVTGRWYDAPEPVESELGLEFEDPKVHGDLFSKSSFAEFFKCPRAFMFHALVSIDSQKSTEFGSLIHDFAELYLCYPEKVEELGLERLAEMVSDRYVGLSTPVMNRIDNSRIVKAMDCVRRYIDHLAFRPALDRDVTNAKYPNSLFVALGIDTGTTSCETDNISHRHKVHGKFDLLAPGCVVDYKTGKARSTKEIRDEMTLEGKVKYPDFQPLIYLLVARELHGVDRFDLFYIFDNDTQSSRDDYDITKSVREVRVMEGSVFDTLRSPESLHHLEDILSKDYKPFAEGLVELIESNASDDVGHWSEDEGLKSRAVELIGKNVNKTNLKNSVGAINKVAGMIKDGYVLTKEAVLVPSETLDRFAEFIDSEHERMRTMSVTEFPAMPRIECTDCEYRSLCTRNREVVIDQTEVGQ